MLLITAAFFNRVTELDFARVTVKMAAATAAATKADELSGGDPEKRSEILKKTADIALSQSGMGQRVPLTLHHVLQSEPTEIDSVNTQDVVDAVNNLVQRAANQLAATD